MHDIIEKARSSKAGQYLPSEGETCFRTLDGSDVAAWLVSQGYKIHSHGEGTRNGWARTTCGICVSTNGYVHTYKEPIYASSTMGGQFPG